MLHFLESYSQNANYTVSWSKEDAVSGIDEGNDVVIDSNGDAYVTGSFSGTSVDFDPDLNTTVERSSNGGSDVYVQKLSASGNLLWVKTFGGTANDAGVDLSINSSGELLMVANYRNSITIDETGGSQSYTSVGDVDFVVLKIDTATGDADWSKSYGSANLDLATAVAVDEFNGVYIVGQFSDSITFDTGSTLIASGGRDIFILKLTVSNGNHRWVQNHGSISISEEASTVAADPISSEVIIGGTYFNTVDFDASSGTSEVTSTWGRECFALKLDSAGGFVWVRSFDGDGNENMRSITTDSSSNIYLTGNYSGTFDVDPDPDDPANQVQLSANSSTEVFLIKLDSTGDYKWEYHTDGDDTNIPLDLFYNHKNDVISTVGYFRGNTDFNPSSGQTVADIGGRSLFVINVEEQGNSNRTFISVNTTGNAEANSVFVDENFSLYLAGEFRGTIDFDFGVAGEHERISAGITDAYVIKYDTCTETTTTQTVVACDSFLWIDDSTYTNSTDSAIHIMQAKNGCDSIVLLKLTIHQSSDNNSLIDSKTNYTVSWSKEDAVSGIDEGNDVVIDSNGDAYVTGSFSGTSVDFDPDLNTTVERSSNGGSDVYVQKLSASGNLLWVKTFGGTANDAGVDLSINSSGELLMVANYRNSITIDETGGSQSYTSVGDVDFVVLKIDTATGDADWSKSYGSANLDLATAVAVDEFNGVYIVGQFSDSITFDTGSTLIASGGRDIFILKLTVSNGNHRWVQNHGSISISEEASTVAADPISSEVIIGGTYFNTVDFDASSGTSEVTSTWGRECFALKLDSAGGFVWVRSFDGDGNENMRSITTDSSSNIYLTGNYSGTFDVDPDPDDPANQVQLSANSSTEVFLIKLDSTGDYKWEYHTDGDDTNIPLDLFYNHKNDVISTVGYFRGNTDFNPSSGQTVADIGGRSLFVINVEEQGNSNRTFISVNTTGNAEANSVFVDENFSLYLAGEFRGTIDFDFGVAGEHERISAGITDAYVIKYDTCTETTTTQTVVACDSFLWIDDSTYTNSTDSAIHIMQAKNGCDSIVLLNLTVYQSSDNSSLLMRKRFSDKDYVSENIIDNQDHITKKSTEELLEEVSIYPNPTQGLINIKLGEIKNPSIRIFSLSGQMFYEFENVTNVTHQVNLNLEKGVYFVIVSTAEENKTYKLIMN